MATASINNKFNLFFFFTLMNDKFKFKIFILSFYLLFLTYYLLLCLHLIY